MKHSCPHDPFKKARGEKPVLATEFGGEAIPMILRHKDVRQAARDYKKFSSDAPFRVPIPSEESVRSVRQLPIETDPPIHTEYRKLVEPMFRRPTQPEFAEKVERLVEELLDAAEAEGTIEVVRDFALPLQSRALTYLLGVPESEAETWIGWGTHVFKEGDGARKGADLEDYINAQFDRAEQEGGEDFFATLAKAEFQGRALTRDEMVGFANLVFAGGRDTIINTVSYVICYAAENPEEIAKLKDDSRRVLSATEEFMRVVTALTHIGRKCPVDTDVHGEPVKADQRISLCWAAANYDETVFESPEEVRLDRRPNPHIAFGAGAHNCLGAAHARLIVRTLLQKLLDRGQRLELLEAEPLIEKEKDYERRVGYETLKIRFGKA